MDDTQSIPLHEADREMLNLLASEYQRISALATVLKEQADSTAEYRQAYIRSLIRKANASLDLNYRISPDGKVLAPVLDAVEVPPPARHSGAKT